MDCWASCCSIHLHPYNYENKISRFIYLFYFNLVVIDDGMIVMDEKSYNNVLT